MMRIRWVAILVLVLPLLLAPAAFAGPPSGNRAVAEVEELEHARQHAMVAVDEAALTRILSPDLVYVHSTGLAQSRSDLLGMLQRGDIQYLAFRVESVVYRAYGSTVVGTGVQAIDLTSSGRPFVSRSRYTVVYAPVDGKLQMVSYQSTTMPEIVMQETGGDRRAP